MIELSRTQDEEVGDGTTSVIILGEFMPIPHQQEPLSSQGRSHHGRCCSSGRSGPQASIVPQCTFYDFQHLWQASVFVIQDSVGMHVLGALVALAVEAYLLVAPFIYIVNIHCAAYSDGLWQ